MKIVDIDGLDPAYRVYEHGGVFVRVRIDKTAESDVSDSFEFTAQITDEAGAFEGAVLPPVQVTDGFDAADLPTVARIDTGSVRPGKAKKGDLIFEDGKLYQFDKNDWVHRATVAETASDVAMERLAQWDTIARDYVLTAYRVHIRQQARAEIDALIGV